MITCLIRMSSKIRMLFIFVFKFITIHYHTKKQRNLNLIQGYNWTTTYISNTFLFTRCQTSGRVINFFSISYLQYGLFPQQEATCAYNWHMSSNVSGLFMVGPLQKCLKYCSLWRNTPNIGTPSWYLPLSRRKMTAQEKNRTICSTLFVLTIEFTYEHFGRYSKVF